MLTYTEDEWRALVQFVTLGLQEVGVPKEHADAVVADAQPYLRKLANGAPAGVVVVEIFAYFHAERIAAAMKAEHEASGCAMH